jgi:hypothetical protein
VCSNVLVYLITWLVLHVTAENDAQICPQDAEKFQVSYTVLQISSNIKCVLAVPGKNSSCDSTAYSVDWH